MKRLPYFSSLAYLCLSLFSGEVFAIKDVKVVEVVLPLQAREAKGVREKMVAAGLGRRRADELSAMLRETPYGDSRPLIMQGKGGKDVCLSMVWKDEALDVAKFSRTTGPGIDRALISFVAAHEKAHCNGPVARLDSTTPDVEESLLWRDEALADSVARREMRTQGRTGLEAARAWQAKRIFSFLAGDITHWTTPLVGWMESANDISVRGAENAFEAIGGEKAFEDINSGWSKLIKALFSGADGGAEQSAAWNAAFNELPPLVRPALPELDEIRQMAKHAWPDSSDWRLEATDRKKAPKL